MKIFNKKYFKLIIVLGVAFILSNFLSKNLFLANSPKINPFAYSNMIVKAKNIWSKTNNFFASIKINNISFQSANKNNFSLNRQPNSSGWGLSPVNEFNTEKIINSLPNNVVNLLSLPLTKISQGIYAGEKDNVQITEFRTGEIEFIEYLFNVNGKVIKIKIPKDQQVPTQKEIDQVFK